jgi:Bacterial protein of unknown function (DUF899)
LRRQIERVAAQRRALPTGGQKPKGCELISATAPVGFSSLFRDKDTLMVYSMPIAGEQHTENQTLQALYNCGSQMAHPLQSHYDRVSALLKELRAALEDHAVFRRHREAFDEYLEANELELALHTACDAFLESPSGRPSAEVLQKIEDLHKAMELRDDCVQKLIAL